MFEIEVRNRFKDLSKSLKSLYILVLGVFIAIISYLLYRNLIVTTTLGVCAFLSYVLLSQPPKKVKLKISDEGLNYDGDVIGWETIISWTMVDLGDDLEFVILTSNPIKDFYYFYIAETHPGVKKLVSLLTQFLTYDESIASKNRIHKILRDLGLS